MRSVDTGIGHRLAFPALRSFGLDTGTTLHIKIVRETTPPQNSNGNETIAANLDMITSNGRALHPIEDSIRSVLEFDGARPRPAST